MYKTFRLHCHCAVNVLQEGFENGVCIGDEMLLIQLNADIHLEILPSKDYQHAYNKIVITNADTYRTKFLQFKPVCFVHMTYRKLYK
jgi:hypothetical protein